MKIYDLKLPDVLSTELQEAAQKKGITVEELLKKFITLGLVAIKLEDEPEGAVIIRTKENGDRELSL